MLFSIENIISVLIILILSICAIKYPPFTLFVISLAVNQGEGFGIARYFSYVGYNLYFSMQCLPLLVACVSTYYYVYKNRYYHCYNYNIWVISSLVMFCLLWILLTLIIKQCNVLSMPNNLIYSGLPVLLIGLNYWHDKKAQNMFIVFLLFHQLLSVLLLALPYGQLAVLAATNYDPGGIDLTGINIEFTGEIARYGEQERVYAQHDNPNTYGLFSIISLAVGFYLISKKTVSCRISSIILIITSFIGVLLTMSRASIFGLLVGSIIVLIRNTRIFRKKESICIAIIAVIFSLYILLNYTVNIIESFEIKDIDMRIDALQVGIEVIKNNPLFGANLAFEWPDNIPPHQIMIYFAAMYGLFAGLLITLLYIISFFAILLKRPNIELCILFGFVCIFTGLANNFAAPILYWLCFSYSLIPIAMSIKINPIKIMPPNFYMQTR